MGRNEKQSASSSEKLDADAETDADDVPLVDVVADPSSNARDDQRWFLHRLATRAREDSFFIEILNIEFEVVTEQRARAHFPDASSTSAISSNANLYSSLIVTSASPSKCSVVAASESMRRGCTGLKKRCP